MWFPLDLELYNEEFGLSTRSLAKKRLFSSNKGCEAVHDPIWGDGSEPMSPTHQWRATSPTAGSESLGAGRPNSSSLVFRLTPRLMAEHLFCCFSSVNQILGKQNTSCLLWVFNKFYREAKEVSSSYVISFKARRRLQFLTSWECGANLRQAESSQWHF